VFDSKREIGNVVKKLKTNKEQEFTKGKFLQENGIHQEFTTPFTHEQNCVAEKDNKTIVQKMHYMSYVEGLKNHF
jgi:hypothetical protein